MLHCCRDMTDHWLFPARTIFRQACMYVRKANNCMTQWIEHLPLPVLFFYGALKCLSFRSPIYNGINKKSWLCGFSPILFTWERNDFAWKFIVLLQILSTWWVLWDNCMSFSKVLQQSSRFHNWCKHFSLLVASKFSTMEDKGESEVMTLKSFSEFVPCLSNTDVHAAEISVFEYSKEFFENEANVNFLSHTPCSI